MDARLKEALKYLSTPAGSFWKWADDGKVVTWSHGSTIAFREELAAVLERLVLQGLPPFDSVLLLIAATRTDWPEDSTALMKRLVEHSESYAAMTQFVVRLDQIHRLPADLIRSVEAKASLIEVVFEFSPSDTTGPVGRLVCDILAHGLVRDLNVIPNLPRLRGGRVQSSKLLSRELLTLSQSLIELDEQKLRLRSRTGLEDLPLPAEIVIPVGSAAIGPLLQELAVDEELFGLSRIARNLSAVLQLPRSLADADELPMGGVSDISNRGTLDRLLLSELAHDDLMLATRVALNEALYLRRETPPSPPPLRRYVLIDSGLRMWGIPRVFAAAAMLSIAAASTDETTVLAYRAAGLDVVPINLSTRAGLVEHLEALELEVHPGRALRSFFQAVSLDEQSGEAIVITSGEALVDPEFRRVVADVNSPPCYVATVARSGEFELWCRGPRGAKLVKSLTLDLDELLKPSSRPQGGLTNPEIDPNLPAIFRATPFPLRLPLQLSQSADHQSIWPVRLPENRRVSQLTAAKVVPEMRPPLVHGVMVLARDRRLVFFDERQRGAVQIAESVPVGKCLWSGSLADRYLCYSLIHRPSDPSLNLIVVNVVSNTLVAIRKLSSQFLAHSGPGAQVLGAAHQAGFLYVVYRSKVEVFELTEGELIGEVSLASWVNWEGGRFFRIDRADTYSEWQMLSWDGNRVCLEPVTLRGPERTGILLRLFDRPGHDGPFGVHLRGSIANLSDQTEWQWTSNPRSNPKVLDLSDDGDRLLIEQDSEEQKPRRIRRIVHVGSKTIEEVAGRTVSLASRDLGMMSQGGTLMHRFSSVFVNADRKLTLVSKSQTNWQIGTSDKRIVLCRIRLGQFQHSCAAFEPARHPNPGCSMQVATWKDGSRAFVDSRGLLHLQSSDPAIPEATLVLNDREVAAWSSDGWICGATYFINETTASIRSGAEFEALVLNPFVERLPN